MFHSVPPVPRVKMERFAGVDPQTLSPQGFFNAIKLRENTNLVLPKSLVAPSKSPPLVSGETLASLFFKSSQPGRIIHSCLF
jgi:hypothetical protein